MGVEPADVRNLLAVAGVGLAAAVGTALMAVGSNGRGIAAR